MIRREMCIAEIIRTYPQTIRVFRSFGLECRECQIADFEDLEHGATVHDVDIDTLLAALNTAVSDHPEPSS